MLALRLVESAISPKKSEISDRLFGRYSGDRYSFAEKGKRIVL
ncbi:MULTISPECIES: hypothetical protein [unclassified Okeania]|nr:MULTISPECIES: hypothetical protein [unclassified Okeania]